MCPLTGIAAAEIDSNTFGDMQARSIGPAVMGGRIAAMDAVWIDDRLHVYVGTATGGIWKSDDGATTFEPIFDDHTMSIGALTIDPSNPETIWVGTGEAWPRNSVSVGEGVFKSTDGGESWKQVGLTDSERIVEILVHPEESDTVYVCATGHLWDANEERGVYKTTDGGENWEAVLQVDADTGCGNLAMDPQEPDVLYAGMWQFRREPWFFTSGGPGSGLYRTTDGGENWERVTEGLPEGELGRIAVAPAPSRPSVVYATVEAEDTGFFRSEDLGKTWTRKAQSAAVEGRPFYFSLIVVDPVDHNRVYKPGTTTALTTDGGENFSTIAGSTHSDHHALWIDPRNVEHLLLGTDGGLYESHNRGRSWTFRNSLPVSQFYQVSFDMERPYNVYGGLQDNGTWWGPSSALTPVMNKHWDNIGQGDGFHAYVDKKDNDIVYLEWQGGRAQRVRKSNGETKDIQPLEAKGEPKYRFNWNAAMHVSPNRDDTLYIGAQFLFRSRDQGDSWERISPDLTTDDPEKQRQGESGGLTIDNSTAENHCSIYRIAEQPGNENTIWVGTDDGNLQLTRDGGRNWTDLTSNIPDLPANTWVTGIDPSPHTPGTAFAVFDGHRTGDMTTYVYRTDDWGKSWTSLVKEPIEGYALAIRQDLVNPKLLFLGTEFGLYVSVDGGGAWARFKGNVPRVGIREIQIHPREHDLILGTHGRGILIVDDLTPLRNLTAETLDAKGALLPSRVAFMTSPSSSQTFNGDNEFVGSTAPGGATIAYYLKKRHMFGDLKIEIYDPEGNWITTLPTTKRRGLNRVSWSMRGRAPKIPPSASLVPQFFSFLGPQVPAGTYKVKLIRGKESYEMPLRVEPHPDLGHSAEDLAAQDKAAARLYALVERLTFLVDRLIDIRDQAQTHRDGLGEKDKLGGRLDDLIEALEKERAGLVATRKGGFIAGEEQLREKLTSLYGSVNGFEGKPSKSHLDYADVLESEVAAAETRFAGLLGDRLPAINGQLERKKLQALAEKSREDWEAEQRR
ncbi:hypothetical protein ABI59_12845 [Acidobacteria bacterium Mor1]|nr:hypothetical protein ABI59_12845 [Acidobacteria bacterium Mor1]